MFKKQESRLLAKIDERGFDTVERQFVRGLVQDAAASTKDLVYLCATIIAVMIVATTVLTIWAAHQEGGRAVAGGVCAAIIGALTVMSVWLLSEVFRVFRDYVRSTEEILDR